MGTKTWTTTADFDTGTVSGLSTTSDELALLSELSVLNTTFGGISTTILTTGQVGQSIVPTADMTVSEVRFNVLSTSVSTVWTVRIEGFVGGSPNNTLAWAGAEGSTSFPSIPGIGSGSISLITPGILSSGASYFVRFPDVRSGLQSYICGDTNTAIYTAGQGYFNSGVWVAGNWHCYIELIAVAAATSGTWTIDVDGSAIVSFTSIACTIGSTVQARIKVAANQAGLGAASWVPSTGYYTTFPTISTAGANQWARLEFSLSGAETVQDITLSWAAILGGNPSSHFGLGMNRKLQL